MEYNQKNDYHVKEITHGMFVMHIGHFTNAEEYQNNGDG